MKELFAFLLISLFVTYTIKPKDKRIAGIIAVFIPLLCIIIYVSMLYILKSPYVAGKELVSAFLPAIISGVFIYFQLKKKINNENKVKFPLLLVILIGLSFTGTIVKYYLESELWRIYQEDAKNNQISSQNSKEQFDSIDVDQFEAIEDNNNLSNFVFNELSFSYPINWKVEREVIHDDLLFYINCQKKRHSSDGLLSISWAKMELTPQEMIQSVIEELKNESTYKNLKIGTITSSSFNRNRSKTVNFSSKILDKVYFGKITAFNTKGHSILILKQSDTKIKLESDFKTIEESIIVN